MTFDYYYGKEAEQFSFYRVPRLLIKDERFKGVSSDAKLLYGLMLDRMSLSMKNGWFDDENRAYIIYTIDNIMEDLGCSKPTCVKILKELDSETGIGLIEKIRRGFGKPDVIYVKNLTSMQNEINEKKPDNIDALSEVKDLDFKKLNNFTSRSKEIELQEVKDFNFKKLNNFTSVGKNFLLQEVKNFNPSYTDINYIDNSYTDMNYIDNNNIFQNTNNINPINLINQPEENINLKGGLDMIDNNLLARIKDNLEYDYHMKYDKASERKLYKELVEVICDTLCIKRFTVRVAEEEYPYEVVKSKFLKLNSSHLQYVIECMKNTTSRIKNIKAYMITALYNAPSTINHYYQQEVQHDMYGV